MAKVRAGLSVEQPIHCGASFGFRWFKSTSRQMRLDARLWSIAA